MLLKRLQFKRGHKKNLPILSQGELAFTIDEKKVYIGDGSENITLLDQKDKSEINNHLAEISINVKTFGAKGNGVNDDTVAINKALSYCVANGKNLFFPVGTYNVSDTLKVNGYIKIFGDGKRSIIKAIGTNENIFTISFATPTTLNYNFSNLEISNLNISGNKNATRQNAICFDSVIVIYNKLRNIWVQGVKGSAIRMINDGSKTQKSFYSHNIYWVGIYLENTSEFLTQDTINNGKIPWVYGGEISDVHIEASSSFFDKDYLFDLQGFHNMNIKDMITEGRVMKTFKSVYRCDNSAIFTNVYFEFLLETDATINSYFELGGGTYKIENPVNLNHSKIHTTSNNSQVSVVGGILEYLNNINHTSSLGKLSFESITSGDNITSNPKSNILLLNDDKVSFSNLDLGQSCIVSKRDSVEIFRLNKDEYISNRFNNPTVSRFNSGNMPTMDIYTDSKHGRVLRLTPVDANNGVYSGVILNLQGYAGKQITVMTRYKWTCSDGDVGKRDAALPGSHKNFFAESNIMTNDKWEEVGFTYIVPSDGKVYIRFDYNSGQTYSVPQILSVSEIVVNLGNEIPKLPIRDDRRLTLYGNNVPSNGDFVLGDECVNTSTTTNPTVYKWVYTTVGWKVVAVS